jgi:hypothetical protein
VNGDALRPAEEEGYAEHRRADSDLMNNKTYLNSDQRAADLGLVIDPSFVNHRKVQTVIGPSGMQCVDQAISQLPSLPDWQRTVRIDHIYSEAMLLFCEHLGIRPLQDILATQTGQMFCSTEKLLPCPDIYDSTRTRAVSVWDNPGSYRFRVEFHYSKRHITGDTLRSRLHDGHLISMIGQLSSATDEVIVFEPLVMGFPWLVKKGERPNFDPMWYSYTFYEHSLEDFDEFSKAATIPTPASPDRMEAISESAFKTCLANLLGDAADKDWGGEQCDYYSAHLHLKGRRLTAAFVLKGPADFRPMGLNHLGKNNDQIVRLSHAPADILFVQHSHDITAPVRETLRAFAVQPSRPRRYCLIDGRDSLRLLDAYGLYDKAVAMSKARKKGRSRRPREIGR